MQFETISNNNRELKHNIGNPATVNNISIHVIRHFCYLYKVGSSDKKMVQFESSS